MITVCPKIIVQCTTENKDAFDIVFCAFAGYNVHVPIHVGVLVHYSKNYFSTKLRWAAGVVGTCVDNSLTIMILLNEQYDSYNYDGRIIL